MPITYCQEGLPQLTVGIQEKRPFLNMRVLYRQRIQYLGCVVQLWVPGNVVVKGKKIEY